MRRLCLLLGSLALLALVPATPALATSTCGASSYAIAPLQSNVFYIDSATSYLGSYVGYKVTNNSGATRAGAWLRLEGFSGGQVRPASGGATTAPVPLAALAGGASSPSYAYLSAATATTSATTFDVVLYNGRPGSGGTEVCRETQTVTSVQDVIKAAANKVNSASGPSSATLGGTFALTVNGSTGTIGAGIASDPGIVRFSPAVAASWPSDAFRLVGVTHQLPLGGATVADLLSKSNQSGSQDYTVTYTFRVVGPTTTPTPIVPVSNIASGTQVKHTDPGSFSALAPIPVVTSTATVTVSAGGTPPYAAGATVPLTITAANTGSAAISLDEIRATLPAGWAPVAGSWKQNGATLADPYNAGGGAYRATGPFTVPANGTTTFTFDATAGAAGTSGAYSAIGTLAGGQVDRTTNASDDAPSSTTLNVLGAPIAVNDSASVASGVARDVDVLANDSTTGATPTLSIASTPANGTATVTGGVIRYTSNNGYSGGDAFTYTLTTAGGSSTATVTVTVAAAPAPPSPAAKTSTGVGTAQQSTTLTIPAGDAVALLGTATNTLVVAGQGTYTLNPVAGTITFDPELGYAGTATPAGYRLTDAFGQTGDATYTPTVTAPAAPSPGNRTSTGTGAAVQDVTLTIPAHDTVTLLDANGVARTTVTFTGEGQYTLDPATGHVTFSPEATFHGTATGVAFRLTDAYNQTGDATYTPTVTLPAAPSAGTVTSSGTGTTPQSATPAVPTGDTITLLDASNQPTASHTVAGQGTYTIDPTTGAITFTAVFGFHGTPSPVGFRITDGYGQTADGQYQPTVGAPAGPTAPTVLSSGIGTSSQSQTLTAPAGGSVALLDANGNATAIVTVSGEGTYAIDLATGTVTFSPALGFAGVATGVHYRLTDAYGQTIDALYRPTVLPPALTPAAQQTSSGQTGQAQTQALAVPVGATAALLDALGHPTDRLVLAGVGVYALDAASNTITFTPADGFAGTAPAVRYRITDAYGQASDGTFTPTVLAAAAPAAKVAAPAATPPASGPAPAPVVPKACASRRRMTLHWRLDRHHATRIAVTVNGRVVARLPGTARQTTVDMRGLPATAVTVTVTATTAHGTRSTTRRYRTCAPRETGPALPTLRLR